MTIRGIVFLSLAFFFAVSCGNKAENKSSSNQPKDLNFAEITDVATFCDKVRLSITSRRSSTLISQFPADNTIDARALKMTVNSYAQAISQKDWVIDDLDLVQDGNKFSKTYRWLDKRRRMAMTIKPNVIKQGNEIKLQSVEFDTNIEVLEKITY